MSECSLPYLSESNYDDIIMLSDIQYGGAVLSDSYKSTYTKLCVFVIILSIVACVCIYMGSSKNSAPLKTSGYAALLFAVLILFVMCICFCGYYSPPHHTDWTL